MINAGTVGAYLTLDISDFTHNLTTAGQMLDDFQAGHSDGGGGKGGLLHALSQPLIAAGEAAADFARRFGLAGDTVRGDAQVTGGVLGGLSGILSDMTGTASSLAAKAAGTAAGIAGIAASGRTAADSAQEAAGSLGALDTRMSESAVSLRRAVRGAVAGMKGEIVGGAPGLFAAARANGTGIVSATDTALGGSSGSGGLRGVGIRAIGGLCAGMESQNGSAVSAISGIMRHMLAAAGAVSFTGIGGGIVSGILRGINEKKPGLISSAASLAQSAAAAAKRALGINSPSRVMMEVGRHTAEGMEIGLMQGARRLYSTASAISLETAEALSGISSGGVNLSGNHSTNYGDRLDKLLEAVERLADSPTTMEIDGRSFGRLVKTIRNS